MSEFVHLHVHSEYSLLDGLGKLDLLIEKAKSFGMDSLAITDHGAMYGAFKFYLRAKAAGIKPIIGVETYIARRRRFDREAKIDTDPYHLVLLAENENGYRNLCRLVTYAHLEGYYYRPRIDWELLKNYHEGLIGLSACLHGHIPSLISEGKETEAEKTALMYAEIFGPDRFYLELQKHPQIAIQDEVNSGIYKLSKKLGLPLVATNDVHYIEKEDAEAQDILLCVQTQHTVLEPHRPMKMIDVPDFYMKSPQEMEEQFRDYPEAIKNTRRISDMCNLNLSVGKWILPKYPIPEGETPASHLKKMVSEKLPLKYKNVTPEITDRINYELDIINGKGYSTYFLIVQDFVNWAKSQDIGVGPGRGSGAGSIISYILNITGVDPLYFNLPFERFLNPFRPSPPDIDLDFADDKRDEVIAYVTQKYGNDKVAQICTFGTMEARGAIRDAGRALGMPYAKPDRIARMIPVGLQGSQMTIDKALNQSAELGLAYRSEPDTQKLLNVARKLEGVARHISVHAAGVVIADRPLVDYTPLQRESKKEKIITQYDMYTIGEDGVGLLKMDFLGLRNLTIMSQAIKYIKKNRGIDIDISNIPFDDAKTYEMLGHGETTGVFQLESAGMRRYIKELKPTSVFDLMAMVALFRPGPMQVIPEFIARKLNPDKITYPDPRLKDVLKQSYGIIAYQDDVLLTAITLAGYTWGDADKLRKAVGKKIPTEMKKQREKFTEGCIKNGLSKQKAEEIFTLIEPFAGYGFNKAHAACYAIIAYQTAYLKSNYKVEYMTAVLTAESRANTGTTRDEKITNIVSECRRVGIKILPPDINKSDIEFTIEGDNIRFGLSAIKNVGEAAIETILNARNKDEFSSIIDFVHRVDLSKVNIKTLESMIKTGALDRFGTRSSLLSIIKELLESAHKDKKVRSEGQSSLFDGGSEGSFHENSFILPKIEEYPSSILLSYEKELLGFYLTSHPLESRTSELEDQGVISISEIIKDRVGERLLVGGIILEIKKITTRSTNSDMAFIKLEDLTGQIEVVIFPKIYANYNNLCRKDKVILISGRVDEKDDRVLVIAEEIRELKETGGLT